MELCFQCGKRLCCTTSKEDGLKYLLEENVHAREEDFDEQSWSQPLISPFTMSVGAYSLNLFITF